MRLRLQLKSYAYFEGNIHPGTLQCLLDMQCPLHLLLLYHHYLDFIGEAYY
ncbi:hypothetical protein Lalb_Chr21g0312931 [Lupinus albus]|uniref:Uncharacterized protein n=1 Tax=Lupinus albus TaxID=3870 RepID=A0A6A4N6U7_LUPAL|nr:hypothetical protein Lalb_Chr21g0312931 [Lupinus albus]